MTARLGSGHGLRVGMTVTSDYDQTAKDVRRTLTRYFESNGFGSGWGAAADAGEPCPTCRRYYTTHIGPVDAAWFIPVVDKRQ